MKKSKRKALQAIAEKLPQQYRTFNGFVLGSEILEVNPEAKDEQGKEIQPNKVYPVIKRIPINNYRKLKKMDKQYGLLNKK